MEQTLQAFFQTTFESIGRVCAARHARGGLELQGKWRTRACVPHTPYIRATACYIQAKACFKAKYLKNKCFTTDDRAMLGHTAKTSQESNNRKTNSIYCDKSHKNREMKIAI